MNLLNKYKNAKKCKINYLIIRIIMNYEISVHVYIF